LFRTGLVRGAKGWGNLKEDATTTTFLELKEEDTEGQVAKEKIQSQKKKQRWKKYSWKKI